MSGLDPNASSITVAVRVRPFTIREAAQLIKNDDGTLFLGDGSLAGAPTPKLNQRGIRSVIKVVDDRCLVFDPPEDNPVQKFSRSVVPSTGKRVKDQVFAFDRIFDDNASQIDVYEGTTKGLLDSVLDGYNATVFAYGATGCGKTHTITGTSQHPGIIFLTMQELFEKINERSEDKATELSLSYLEIYNETIRDLLVPGGSKQGLMLREDSNQAVMVSGLTSHHPRDVQEVMDMIVQGNEYRTVSPTEANAVSSRSHAVLQINVAQRDRNAAVSEPHTMATLSIIDLAGSERASATKNRGERLIEGANINKSLLALGSCINALCDPRKRNHVPYRNSKLTRLLKFSLGGNCKTVMIVCVSPSSVHFDETQNTLRYANRAKNIQTKVTRNVFNVNRHVKDFLVKIDEQMALINELRAQQKDAEQLSFAKFRKLADKRDAAAREGILRLRAAYEHAASERRDKVAAMKRLRGFERRIGVLSAWIAAFDTVCDARADGDESAMPPALAAVRKTAQGILAELEHSRQHMHQKLERSNWDRALDSALQHSLEQLAAASSSGDGAAASDSYERERERDTLVREAELLKSAFTRDAHAEVLEQERSGDAALLQVLLTAQFEMVASLADTLAMSEEEAVAHAKDIIHRLLQVGSTAAAQVVKPDGSAMPVVEAFPPSRRGTPKRKKSLGTGAAITAKPMPAPPALLAAAGSAQQLPQQQQQQQQGFASPMVKGSPRRRKAGPVRKGVSVAFTPVKKKSPAKRMVRWRDDETEQGTLADFEKTPKKFASATPEQPGSESSPAKTAAAAPVLAAPTTSTPTTTTILASGLESDESSPSITLPEISTSLPTGRPSMFQAGFLSKSSSSSRKLDDSTPNSNPRASPVPPTFSLSLSGSSPSPSDREERPTERSSTPLRSIPVSRAANAFSPPNYISSLHNGDNNSARANSPKLSLLPTATTSTLAPDENNPPASRQRLSTSASASDSESTPSSAANIDPQKLRSALHSAKRRDRLSSISGGSGMSSGTRRVSSAGHYHRPSASYSGPPPLSSTNGISRHHRRASAERRRSPPIACSPDSSFGSFNGGASAGSASGSGAGAMPSSRAFTPGQARRMNIGGSVRLDSGSPRERERLLQLGGGTRRVTIGGAALAAGAGATAATTASAPQTAPSLSAKAQRPSVAWR